MAQYVALADRAFVDENYQEAIELYTKALQAGQALGDSTPSKVYEARASANFKLQNFMEAVQDASKAIELDAGNARAYLRKGTACYKLEEYEAALAAFQQGLAVQPNNPQLDIWIQKCKNALTAEGQPIPEAPAVAYHPSPPVPQTVPVAPKVTFVPAAKAEPEAAAAKQPAAPAPAPASSTQQQQQQQQPQAAAAPPSSSSSKALAPAAPQEHVGKYRHQWYQIGPKVVLDVYAKGLPKDAVSAAVSGADNDHLAITIKAPPAPATAAAAAAAGEAAGDGAGQQQHHQQQQEDDFVLELDLYGPLAADAPVQVEVLRTKVEVTLAKADPALNWAALDKAARGPAPAGVAAAAVAQPAATAAGGEQQQQQQQGPPRAYPSSKGPKDWSKFEAEVKELEEKGELEDGDPLNSFFKKIFSQGDEDTRRAMMKSFVESNGTVLSTNWQEVGAKKIECTPPEGMELHKWNE